MLVTNKPEVVKPENKDSEEYQQDYSSSDEYTNYQEEMKDA